MRSYRLWAVVLLLIGTTCEFSVASSGEATVAKPNIVFILADDLGWYDLGCYGNRFTETPHIDQLAADGMRFTDAYAPAALCVPSRAGMALGQTPARLHLTNNPAGNRDKAGSPVTPVACPNPFVVTSPAIAEPLKNAGYTTGIVGKWHVDRWTLEGAPDRHGFDVAVGKPSHYSQVRGFDGNDRNNLIRNGISSGEPYAVDLLTDRAVEFLEDHHEEPFFLYFAHFAVHIPLLARAEKVAKYQEKALSYEPEEGELVNAHYAAMVESVDDSVGRILETLRRLKVDDNTVVVFFSDNGGLATTYHASGHQEELEARGNGCYTQFVPATSNGPLRFGKGYLYEGGIREPCLVRWPGVTRPGSVCRTPIVGYDFYPTFCEIAGQDVSGMQLDGLSLCPLLEDGNASLSRDAICWHFPHFSNEDSRPSSAIRMGRWKLIEHLEYGKVELYDLEEDLGETVNVATRMPERTKQLKKMLDAWREDVDAAMPTPRATTRP